MESRSAAHQRGLRSRFALHMKAPRPPQRSRVNSIALRAAPNRRRRSQAIVRAVRRALRWLGLTCQATARRGVDKGSEMRRRWKVEGLGELSKEGHPQELCGSTQSD